jgi:hypothetical protein
MGDIRRIRVCMFYLCFTRLNGCLHGGYYMDTCMHVMYSFYARINGCICMWCIRFTRRSKWLCKWGVIGVIWTIRVRILCIRLTRLNGCIHCGYYTNTCMHFMYSFYTYIIRRLNGSIYIRVGYKTDTFKHTRFHHVYSHLDVENELLYIACTHVSV